MTLTNVAPNFNIVTVKDHSIYFSYETPVIIHAFKDNKYYVTNSKHSTTTSRHVSLALKNVSPERIEYKDQEFINEML